jgi:uncharacterized protein YegJ (DUF2314 family)
MACAIVEAGRRSYIKQDIKDYKPIVIVNVKCGVASQVKSSDSSNYMYTNGSLGKPSSESRWAGEDT